MTKWVIGGIVGFVLIVLVCVGLSIGGVFAGAKVAEITEHPRVISKVEETENVIAKIALFHDRCTQVNEKIAIFKNNYGRYQADREAVRNLTGLEASSAQAQLPNDVSDYTAALNAAETAAQEYNSASAQYTQDKFKSSKLPYRILLPAGNVKASYAFTLNCQ